MAKQQIYRELIAGRLSLPVATARVLDLTTAPEQFRKFSLMHYKDGSNEERLERAVIDFACDMLRNEPARAQEVRTHLLGKLVKM